MSFPGYELLTTDEQYKYNALEIASGTIGARSARLIQKRIEIDEELAGLDQRRLALQTEKNKILEVAVARARERQQEKADHEAELRRDA